MKLNLSHCLSVNCAVENILFCNFLVWVSSLLRQPDILHAEAASCSKIYCNVPDSGCAPSCRTLNRIQSRIYHTAFHSNENILVCAPTGAGKTNIAMIAILRELAASMQQGKMQRYAFKIVYVAPMKALAAEQTATFSRRLAELGAPALPCYIADNLWYSLGYANLSRIPNGPPMLGMQFTYPVSAVSVVCVCLFCMSSLYAH